MTGGKKVEVEGRAREETLLRSERNTSQEVLLVSPRLEAMTAVAGELAWDNGTRLARYPHRGERAAVRNRGFEPRKRERS